ncbi:MAG TPA: DUF1844 domain-containing protein [bacterium]|nr:DUF1844 domain-containing protein [bacterium]HQL61732.1 DUF1844 domain-containing protein [bacterium]
MNEQSAPREVTFQDFVFMMSTSALVGLGHVPNPVTNKYETDLESVRHTISLLTMIQQKTKGNLTSDEDDMLERVLHELRMGFLAKAKESPTSPPSEEKKKKEDKPGRIILP